MEGNAVPSISSLLANKNHIPLLLILERLICEARDAGRLAYEAILLFCVSLSVCLSVCLCLSLSVYLCVSIFVCLSLCLCVSVCASVCVCLSLSVCVSLSVRVSVFCLSLLRLDPVENWCSFSFYIFLCSFSMRTQRVRSSPSSLSLDHRSRRF